MQAVWTARIRGACAMLRAAPYQPPPSAAEDAAEEGEAPADEWDNFLAVGQALAELSRQQEESGAEAARRQEAARQEAVRQEAARQAAARQEAARQAALRQAALRQKALRQAAGRSVNKHQEHPGDPDEPGAKRPALPGGTPME
ncbi:hypothetical protein GPECTOR_723g880 [Gonium pectorale]|uniref:Uncharacterized protein n=1 Tax=Gonium pectorale TaxID=33097 RepID=A0A150FU68_GONPE|nr:hypothetical protein GPECTOR_723g880 [Gonium pectorale]|eukprot:KXZ41146.1 hypothetical protein GPECTOR_723g880 [Gonium pectorale]